MNKDKTISLVNDLIQINNDRIEGYRTAGKETEDFDLKALFAAFVKTSEKCREELVQEIKLLGGEPTESTKVTGKFFRVWMDMKAALTANDQKNILESCEFGEEAALDTYKKVLEKKHELPLNLATLIDAQFDQIQTDYNKIKLLLKELPQ